ncbi:Retrovirus-related Pol polyprotein from transposon TNT 1-94, partial [Ananas comosus]
MSNELQRQHEDMKTAKEMLTHLKELYGEQSRSARFEVSKRLFKAKMHDGQSVHDHCLTMIKDLEELEKLGVKMDKELQVDLILQSLPVSYGQFIVNYHMNKIDCTNAELLNMLITTEGTLKSSKGSILAVERASSSKRKSNWKKKPAKKQKTKNKPKKEASKNKAADKGKCFHCNVD